MVVVGVLGHWAAQSSGALAAITGTYYPGSRVSPPGQGLAADLFAAPFNPLISANPEVLLPGQNESEFGAPWLVLPVVALLLVIVLWQWWRGPRWVRVAKAAGEPRRPRRARCIAPRQVREFVAGTPVTKEVYPHQIAFNVLPHVDSFLPSGYTKEEMKMENEGRKIMHHPGFRASVTCVRVPVFRAHSVAVSAEFEKPVTLEAARAVLSKAPGLDVVDDPANKSYPMPLDVSGKYNCAVGRLRLDCALDNGLCFWVAGDQLLKGAALNAVQIAEELLR